MFRKTAACLAVTVGLLPAVGTAFGQLDPQIVPVGHTGNLPDVTGFGEVPYEYFIGTYEVTNAEYALFLNTVAALGDPYGLYHLSMGLDDRGGIIRKGEGSERSPYRYQVKPGKGNRPVNFVSFFDAVRFANWMTNGYLTGGTEWGSYTILDGGPDSGIVSPRLGIGPWVLPTEDEWYKAAYYDPQKGDTGGYWRFSTRSDNLPGIPAIAPSASPANSPAVTGPSAGTQPALLSDVLNVGGKLIEAGGVVIEVGGQVIEAGGQILAASGRSFLTGLAAVGTVFADHASFYSTFDQCGNVREWTENTVNGKHVLRGGAWNELSRGMSFVRELADPDHADALTGFRIARISVISGEPVSPLADAGLRGEWLSGAVGGGRYGSGMFSGGGGRGGGGGMVWPSRLTEPPRYSPSSEEAQEPSEPQEPQKPTPPTPPTPPIPEPGSGLMLALAGAAWLRVRPRTRRPPHR